jgi:hypothetical protein
MTQQAHHRPRRGSVSQFYSLCERLHALPAEGWERLFAEWRSRFGGAFPNEEEFRKYAVRDREEN